MTVPIISPWLIYLIDTVEPLIIVLTVSAIISIITFSKKMDILNKKVTKEKGLSEYRQELEIIKKEVNKQ